MVDQVRHGIRRISTEAVTLLAESIEAAKNGLQWYRENQPAADSQADDEMHAKLDRCLALLASAEDGDRYSLPPIVLSGYQLQEALGFVAPDSTAEQLEQEVCIAARDRVRDEDEGTTLPAGYFVWLEEYPEEGLMPLDGRPSISTASLLSTTSTPASIAAEGLTACNCRWRGEEQVQQCTLHQAHVDALHEWASRAKRAEATVASLTVGRDHLLEAQRQALIKLPRFSFLLLNGGVSRVADPSGRWIELDEATAIVEHERADVMLRDLKPQISEAHPEGAPLPEFNASPFAWARWSATGVGPDIMVGSARPDGEGWFSVHARFNDMPPLPAPAKAHEGAGLADTLRGIAGEHSIELTETARRALDRAAELLTANAQPKHTSGYTEVDDKLLTGQAQYLIGALMNHGLLPGKTLPEDKYLKLWDVVKAQLRAVHREAVRAAQAPAPAPATAGLRKAAQDVLDRWNSPKWEWAKQGPTADLMAKLREELEASPAPAVQDGKPAAWIRWEWNRSGGKSLEFFKPDELSLADEARGVVYDPLYGRPLAPLSERAILDLAPTTMPIANDFDLLWFARAVERAHGIGKHDVPVQHKEGA